MVNFLFGCVCQPKINEYDDDCGLQIPDLNPVNYKQEAKLSLG